MSRNIIINHTVIPCHTRPHHVAPQHTSPYHTHHSIPYCPIAQCSSLCRPAWCNLTVPVIWAYYPSPFTSCNLLHVLLRTIQMSTVLDNNSLISQHSGFETRSCYRAQAGLRHMPIFLPQLPEFWDDRYDAPLPLYSTAPLLYPTPHTPHHISHVTPFQTMHPTPHSTTPYPKPRTPHILHNTSQLTLYDSK